MQVVVDRLQLVLPLTYYVKLALNNLFLKLGCCSRFAGNIKLVLHDLFFNPGSCSRVSLGSQSACQLILHIGVLLLQLFISLHRDVIANRVRVDSFGGIFELSLFLKKLDFELFHFII